MLGEDGKFIIEIDRARRPRPRRCWARSWPRPSCRRPGATVVLDAIRRVVEGRWGGLADGVELRYLWDRMHVPPPLAGRALACPARRPTRRCGKASRPSSAGRWRCSGLRSGMEVERDDVNRRFRRLLRDAHPDSRRRARPRPRPRIAELTEARTILLDLASAAVAAEG